MAPIGLRHWMLHNDKLASEYDETLKLSPGYDPVREVDPALTFHAPLLTGPDSIPGAIRAIVERNSEGIYRAPRGALLISAADDESRHEYTPKDEPLGILMESASTNSSGVDNLERVDPDDWLLSGGPATIERIIDHDLIASAGLTKLCPNGELLRITAQSNCRFWLSPSSPGSTEDLGLSVYARGRFYLHSGYASSPQFTHEALERAEYIDTAANALRVFSVSVDAGDVCEFIGWGIEIQNVVTSLIHTPFGPASRAVDQLSWPLAGDAGSILNQSEGMYAVQVRFGFSHTDLAVNTASNILDLADSSAGFCYVRRAGTGEGQVGSESSDSASLVSFDFTKDQTILIVCYWDAGANQHQIAIRHNGTWVDGPVRSYTSFLSTTEKLGLNHAGSRKGTLHNRDIRLWNVNRGLEWLKAYCEGVYS